MKFGGDVRYKKSTIRREFVPAPYAFTVRFLSNLRILLFRECGRVLRHASRRGASGISFTPGPRNSVTF